MRKIHSPSPGFTFVPVATPFYARLWQRLFLGAGAIGGFGNLPATHMTSLFRPFGAFLDLSVRLGFDPARPGTAAGAETSAVGSGNMTVA